MARLEFRPVDGRKEITIFCFSDEFNQIVYSCVANNLKWAQELFIEQFETPEAGQERLATVRAYKAELTGANFINVEE